MDQNEPFLVKECFLLDLQILAYVVEFNQIIMIMNKNKVKNELTIQYLIIFLHFFTIAKYLALEGDQYQDRDIN